MKLLLSIILLFIMSSKSIAASQGTLILTGIVGAEFNLVITPNANATTLPVASGGTVLVASVLESTNNSSGYKIVLKTSNGGVLKNTISGVDVDTAPYQLKYDGVLVTPTTTNQVVKTGTLGTDTSDIEVILPAKPNAVAGTYTDTVTVEIVAP